MSVDLTALTASPSTVAPGGGTSTITPTYTNPSQTITIEGVDQSGDTATVNLTINPETVTLAVASTLPTQAPAGQIVACITSGASAGTLTVDAAGTGWTFTAS